MIGILLAVLELVLVAALLGYTLEYVSERDADVDLSQLAAVLGTLFAVHRIRKEKKRERQRQYREFKER